LSASTVLKFHTANSPSFITVSPPLLHQILSVHHMPTIKLYCEHYLRLLRYYHINTIINATLRLSSASFLNPSTLKVGAEESPSFSQTSTNQLGSIFDYDVPMPNVGSYLDENPLDTPDNQRSEEEYAGP